MAKMSDKRDGMANVLWVAGFIVLWFLLQTWILPKLGVST
jgi:energy-converting hydrogenase Eha subunit G